MKRRQFALAGVATAAAATGAGWGLWRIQQPGGPEQVLWDMRFEGPHGSEVSMPALRGKPLVLNFWATWCAPCVEELPLLDAFYQQQAAAGLMVIGLAVDGAAPVREFLTRRPVKFPIGMAGFEGVGLSRQLGNAQGGLPFSAVLDRSGRLLTRKLGALTSSDLSGWARQVLT